MIQIGLNQAFGFLTIQMGILTTIKQSLTAQAKAMEAEKKQLEELIMDRLRKINALKLNARFGYIRKFGYMPLERQDIAEHLRDIMEPRGYRMIRCVEEGYLPGQYSTVGSV